MKKVGTKKRCNVMRRSRIARLEELETRELLSASNLISRASTDDVSVCMLASLASASPSIPLDELRTSDSFEFSAAQGTTIVVTTASDVENATDGVTSLREALATSGVETITFAASLKGKTIKLTKELTIPKQGVTIDASSLWNSSANAPGITIDANFTGRILSASGRAFSLIGLRLANGKTSKDGGALYLTNSSITIDSCVFENNKGGYGGAIAVSNSKVNTVTILNSKFVGNKAEAESSMGGAIYAQGSKGTVEIVNCLMASNSAAYGGVATFASSPTTLKNVTLAGNSASSGGGALYIYSASVEAYNTIFALNTAPFDADVTKSDGAIRCVNCLASGDIWDEGEHNVIVDPKRNTFIDASSGDYRLAPYSKAINAGDAQYAVDAQGEALATDVRRGARLLGSSVDIGAYEYNSKTDVCTNAVANVDYRTFLVSEPYYDADKISDSSDNKLCWAAAISDMLWYTRWGQISGVSDEEALFHTKFRGNFPNDGYDQRQGIGWFLNNEYYSKVVKKAGGYYKSRFSELKETSDLYSDMKPAYGSSAPMLEMAKQLRSGTGVSVMITEFNGSTGARGESHALAVYGYEYNPTLDPTDPNYFTCLYVVDSNDGGRMTNEKDRKLITFDLEWRDSIKTGSTTQGGYVVTNYKLNIKSKALVVVDFLTFLMQRPSKYDSDGGATANLYLTKKIDENPIVLTQLGVSRTKYSPNEEIQANFTFYSTLSSPTRTVQYKIYVDDELVATQSVKGLTKNKAHSPSAPISLGRVESGTHFLTVALDTANTLTESNENDNVFTTTFTVSGSVRRLAKPVVATSSTTTSIKANWEKVPNAKGYKVTCGDRTIPAGAGETSCEFDGLASNTTYTIEARALGDNKKYLDSYPITITAKTDAWIPLGKPTISGSSTIDSITVSWSKVESSSGYEVCCGNETYPANAGETKRSFSGLSSNTEYVVKVRALGDGVKYSDGAFTQKTIKTKAPTQLTKPSTTCDSTTNSITVNWQKVANASGYEVACGNKTYPVDANKTSYSLTGLASDTEYAIQVRALGNGKNYLDSEQTSLSVRTKPLPQLAAPTISSGDATENSITISWTPVADAQSYTVEYAIRGAVAFSEAGVTKDPRFAIKGLASRATYDVRVRANGDGRARRDSDNTESQTYRTLGEPPTFETTTNSFLNGAALRLNAVARLTDGRVASKWRVSWGDGTTETISRLGEATTLAHYYAPGNTAKTYCVSVELIDSTGGGADESFIIATHTTPGKKSNALLDALDDVFAEFDEDIWTGAF
ncbi:MAG: hypothetical protein IJU03_11885 [Thermoguttaceae bacterium]|nr:hypothetical protein [Thermoguttaceae bacterium]